MPEYRIDIIPVGYYRHDGKSRYWVWRLFTYKGTLLATSKEYRTLSKAWMAAGDLHEAINGCVWDGAKSTPQK